MTAIMLVPIYVEATAIFLSETLSLSSIEVFSLPLFKICIHRRSLAKWSWKARVHACPTFSPKVRLIAHRDGQVVESLSLITDTSHTKLTEVCPSYNRCSLSIEVGWELRSLERWLHGCCFEFLYLYLNNLCCIIILTLDGENLPFF